jgi:hypothetical protein
LKDLSSTPPVSRTMHALNAAAVVVAAPPEDELPPVAGDDLDPQATSARALTAMTVTARTAFTEYLHLSRARLRGL